MKNLYGVTPWGSWFVDVLDSYRMGERLDRGRRYANAGKVLSLEFTDCRATAKVQGNYKPFYKVMISFPPLAEAEKVYKLIENDPPLMAQISSGQLPETFLEKLKDDGINLMPRRWTEMKRSCSCPDYGDPCKHMAALYYIIAREIDANPHVLFRLRGMDLSGRFGKALVRTIAPPFLIAFTKKEKNEKSRTPLEFDEIPYCGQLISSLLPANPPFCSRDFAAVMAEFYHRCAAEIEEWESAYDDDEILEKTEHDFSRSDWTLHCPSLVPGTEPVLQSLDINGNKRRYTLYEAFRFFVLFSSDDGTASYNFLFYLFKYLNLLCSAGAMIPYVVTDEDTMKIIWRPYENLPPVSQILNSIASRECGMLSAPYVFKIITSNKQVNSSEKQLVSGRSVVDILSSAFLTEWVRNNFMQIRGDFCRDDYSKITNTEYKQLLNLFFLGDVY